MNDDLLIGAALDDELDAATSLALERRLEAEPALKAKWDEQRALRGALRERASYHAVPDGLRARLAATLGSHVGAPATAGPDGDDGDDAGRAAAERAFLAEALGEPRRPHPRRRPRHELTRRRPARPWGYALGGAIGGGVLTAALLLAWAGPATRHPPVPGDAAQEELARAGSEAREAVSAHTRALLVDHPIEVASADQHTVRPWLSARLNFVPPVADFASQGFTLLGARRDVIAGETSAALVYRRGGHVISVFVRPVTGAPAADAPTATVIRGFNVVQRTHAGMAFCLVSDLNPTELAALADLVTAAR